MRLTAEARGIEEDDLGPDEQHLNLDESEVTSGHLREINRLKTELTSKKADLDSIKLKVSQFQCTGLF